MSRYFFNIRDGVDAVDLEGMELPDLEAALAIARQSARQIMCEMIATKARLKLHERIEIENIRREIVATVVFADVVEIEYEQPSQVHQSAS